MSDSVAPSESPGGANLSGKVLDLFKAAYDNDLDRYVMFFTEDAFYKGGNVDAVIGPEGIRAFAIPVMQTFDLVAHDVVHLWEQGDTVICQTEVVYHRKDGGMVKIPTLNIIRFRDGKISELQAFGDPSPAFSP